MLNSIINFITFYKIHDVSKNVFILFLGRTVFNQQSDNVGPCRISFG